MKVNVILGSSCNQHCNYCIARTNKFNNKPVDIVQFCQKLNNIIPNINKLSFGGGEPLLYLKYIKAIVAYFGDNVKYVITTNGTLIDRCYVDFCNQHNIFTVISLGNWPLNSIIYDLQRLSFSYTIVNNSNINNIPNTDRLICFQCQHNIELIPHITRDDIDQFFKTIAQHQYLTDKFIEYWNFKLANQKDLQACWNQNTVSIDLHFNKYLCFRKLDTQIGTINDIVDVPIRYYSAPCNTCNIKTICQGGCLVSQTPDIECYYHHQANEFYNKFCRI